MKKEEVAEVEGLEKEKEKEWKSSKNGFSRNVEVMLVRGGQDDNDESDEDDEGNEGQEAMNVDEEKSEEEPEEETFRREMRQKKRQERAKKGQLFWSMSQLMEMIASIDQVKDLEDKKNG
ncbi:hypothetical protein M9H77_03392 [Catharanthus roseus]|uniref:Uncharacterized protein n=1 Tax=Catharanthus roseus TaxID=4058 RepID=A0ACC0CBA9_CATRO|nr:hypothetical protein M9H77_03392 [Catharanthus roseus]